MKVFRRSKRSWLLLICLGTMCLFWSIAVLQHQSSSHSASVTSSDEEQPKTRRNEELSIVSIQSSSNNALGTRDTNGSTGGSGVRAGREIPRHNDSSLTAVRDWRLIGSSSNLTTVKSPGGARPQGVEPVVNDRDVKENVTGEDWKRSSPPPSIIFTSIEPPKAGPRSADPATNDVAVKNVDAMRSHRARVTTSRSDNAANGEEGKGYGQCQPHSHVVFLKVHKAASSTVTNILQRFGFTRNLSFVLPNREPHSAGYNFIGHSGIPLEPSRDIIPPPPSPLGGVGGFDILCNHAVYDRDTFRSFMPYDSVHITILRDPFEQFVSAFAYYGPGTAINRSSRLARAPLTERVSAYLHHDGAADRHPGTRLTLINMQSDDLGMTAQHMRNASLRRKYLQQLERDFQLVMLVEYFDESIVLMRRLLCWSMKDVLYIPKNKNHHKPNVLFSAEDRAKHLQLAAADYELYEFFRDKFFRTLAAQKEEFTWEVTFFKQLLRDVAAFCGKLATAKCGEYTKGLSVARSPWNEQFVVTCRDCQLLRLPELSFLDILLSARLSVGDLFQQPLQ